MHLLLILILTGFTLMSIGSPEKFTQSWDRISEFIHQASDKDGKAIDEESKAVETATPEPSQLPELVPSSSEVDYQDDTPASEVLYDHDQVINPDTDLATVIQSNIPQQPVGYQDSHSLEEIQLLNRSTLKILEPLTNKNHQ